MQRNSWGYITEKDKTHVSQTVGNEEIQNSRKLVQQGVTKRDLQPSQQNKHNFSKALESLKT